MQDFFHQQYEPSCFFKTAPHRGWNFFTQKSEERGFLQLEIPQKERERESYMTSFPPRTFEQKKTHFSTKSTWNFTSCLSSWRQPSSAPASNKPVTTPRWNSASLSPPLLVRRSVAGVTAVAPSIKAMPCQSPEGKTVVCLFVCLFVCLLACLLACLFVCLFVVGLKRKKKRLSTWIACKKISFGTHICFADSLSFAFLDMFCCVVLTEAIWARIPDWSLILPQSPQFSKPNFATFHLKQKILKI